MTRVLVDTSSLIAVALATEDDQVNAGATHAMYARHPDLDAGILALTVYDQIFFDQASVERNVEKLPSLQRITSIAGNVYGGVPEDRVYDLVEKHSVPLLQPGAAVSVAADTAVAGELGIAKYGPTATWRHVEHELGGKGALIAWQIGQKLKDENSGPACAVLLRCFYYGMLHQLIGADLALHPLKATVYEPQPSVQRSILDNFDAQARSAFYARKQRWTGMTDRRVHVPILTEYVLRRCKTWPDIPNVIAEVRNSKHAIAFRKAVNTFREALQADDNKSVDATTSELDAALESWQKALAAAKLTKDVAVSVPFVGVGTDFTLPDLKLNKTEADRILAFVYLLLTRS
ncbi:MAG TPA: hypothetical protein VEK57_17245 [Thermoanaerobaculia bacterium]|nr:hypothetical protein [Thermoanaerobaculia bacterium]